jgi:hypothetical protein
MLLLATSSNNDNGNNNVVVVISPPGGIGEMTSIEAARLGGAVKWFVVSAPTTTSTTTSKSSSAAAAAASVKQVSLTAETLTAIEMAGGSLELAGASAESLLAAAATTTTTTTNAGSSSSSNSALSAMASWCANSNCIISTYDNGMSSSASSGMNTLMTMNNGQENTNYYDNTILELRAAIRLATKEAVVGMKKSSSSKDKKNVNGIAILPTGVEEEETTNDDASSGGGSGLFGIDFFGGKDKANEPMVPTTLLDAIGKHHGGGSGSSSVIRYGELFGAPESSVSSYLKEKRIMIACMYDVFPLSNHYVLTQFIPT